MRQAKNKELSVKLELKWSAHGVNLCKNNGWRTCGEDAHVFLCKHGTPLNHGEEHEWPDNVTLYMSICQARRLFKKRLIRSARRREDRLQINSITGRLR